MNHVMIDLETLGMEPNGVFTAIGACIFDPETGEIGKTFHAHVNMESSCRAGRTFTPNTIQWWMSQSKEAQKEVSQVGEPLESVLDKFTEFLPTNPKVWGNGPTLDIVQLETAYGGFRMYPWQFYNVRCVRTITDLCKGKIDRDLIPFVGEKHNALSDAIHQAKYVSLMWQFLKNGRYLV